MKIRENRKEVPKREDRVVRPSIVDYDILWDIISHWRPRQLIAAGRFFTLAEYDLDEDLRSGMYALFPSNDKDVLRTEYSRTDIGDLAGKELHTIARDYLRPDLPAWEEPGT